MAKRALTIVFFLQPGNVSRQIFLAMRRGFERAGHTCLTVELAQIWNAMAAQPWREAELLTQATASVTKLFQTQRVDLSIAMWHNVLPSLAHGRRDGKMVTCFDLMTPPTPHMMYWLDAPHWSNAGTVREVIPTGVFKAPMLFSFVNNAATAEEMRSVLGFRHAMGLAYGVDVESLSGGTVRELSAGDASALTPITPEEMAGREFDLAFSLGPGDPPPSELALRELDRDEPDVVAVRREHAARVRPGLLELAERAPVCVRKGVRAVLASLLEIQIANRHEPMLRRLERIEHGDAGTITRESGAACKSACDALRADLGLFIDTTAMVRQVESVERAFTFGYLARRCKAMLFGDCDVGAWLGGRAGSTRVEKFAPDQGAMYRQARLGLSVMRWQDDVGTHIKPLEAAAAGCVPLVARRVGIEDLFEAGTECEVFDTLSDGLQALRRVAADPARAATIANAARARVVRDHTWTKRAEAMVAEVERGVGGFVVR